MKSWRHLLFACLLVLPFAASADDASARSEIAALAWRHGPTTAELGDKATVAVPDGYVFLDAANTEKFLAMNHNLADGQQYLLAPESLDWFAIFEFEDTGYVKDNEKLDPAELLASTRKNVDRGNEERRRKGWATLSVAGWRFKPQYDSQTHLLEWAFTLNDDATHRPVVNYNTRILGRHGVMQATVVSGPDRLNASVEQFKTLLGQYNFASGERYAEYRSGDKVAEYGMAALITGGAAAIAAKKGLFGIIGTALAAGWKFLLAGFAAVGAWLKSKFGKQR